MKQIPLCARDGSVRAYALVDDEDYARAACLSWSLRTGGYVGRNEWHGKKCVTIRLHNWLTGWARVDHRDGNPLNNQRHNLRQLDQAANCQNRAVNANSSSGVRGVTKRRNGWAARAMVDGRPHWLGVYPTVEEAAVVVQAYRVRHMPHSAEERHA